MKPGMVFLTRLFIYEPGPSTWSPRNTSVWNEDKDKDMKNVIFNIDREIFFTGASKSTFLSFNSQCLSLLVKAASRGFSWQVPLCLAVVPSRKTFILCSELSS